MSCPACGGEQLSFPVSPALREYLPGDAPGASLCRRCLTMRPETDPPEAVPDFTAVSDAFPTNEAAAVPVALLVGLLDSLAVHRQEITALLEEAERAGTDPLLVVDRLDGAFGDDAAVDLGRRRRQLEQFL